MMGRRSSAPRHKSAFRSFGCSPALRSHRPQAKGLAKHPPRKRLLRRQTGPTRGRPPPLTAWRLVRSFFIRLTALKVAGMSKGGSRPPEKAVPVETEGKGEERNLNFRFERGQTATPKMPPIRLRPQGIIGTGPQRDLRRLQDESFPQRPTGCVNLPPSPSRVCPTPSTPLPRAGPAGPA